MSTSTTKLPLLSGRDSSSSPPERVFTESDETKLLESYLKITSESTKPATTITSQSLDSIEASLSSRFSHNQIIDKLRRLRLKYHRQARTKSLIKTPHDNRLFLMAREIWGKRKRVESESRSEELAAVREELSEALRGNRVWEKGFECLGREILRGFNDEWVLLRMKEAELVTRRTELVNELVSLVVEALQNS